MIDSVSDDIDVHMFQYIEMIASIVESCIIFEK